MKKRINAKPVTEIELVFGDGFDHEKVITLSFDTEAVMRFNDFENGINDFIKTKSTAEMCAMVLYVGCIGNDPNFTMDEARKITSNLSPATITEILNEFTESVESSGGGVQKELQKKLMEQFLMNLR